MKLHRLFSTRLFITLMALIVAALLMVTTGALAQSPTPTATTPPMVTTPVTPVPTAVNPLANVMFGQVISVAADKTSFVVQKDDMSQVTIMVNSGTQYSVITISATLMQMMSGLMGYMMGNWDGSGMPGMYSTPSASATPDMRGTTTATPYMHKDQNNYGDMNDLMNMLVKSGSFTDIAVGDVVVMSNTDQNTAADMVLIVKFPDNIKYLQGKVTAIATGSITVTPTQGSAVTLKSDNSSILVLKGATAVAAGQNLMAIYDNATNLFKVAVVKSAAVVAPGATATAVPSVTRTPSPSATLTPVPTATATPTASAAAVPTVTPPASVTVVPTTTPTSTPSNYDVITMTSANLGTYLVDNNGMTLYITLKDSAGKSVVSGDTLKIWPVFYSAGIAVPSNLNVSDFGVIMRDDGAMQTTFRGYPLYYYANDKAAGDTKGQGIGGVWFVVNPDKFPPTASGTPSATP